MPARLIAPSLGALGACCGEGSPYLQPNQFLANVSYRYLHSFREFHGSEEVVPVPNFLFADTKVHGFDLSLVYQATSRLSFSLELPIQSGTRRDFYEHDLTTLNQKHSMHASGIGDLRAIANLWLLDPAKHPNQNLSLGLGFKAPTGKDDAKDFSYRANGPVLRPVDPAIEPGDGGWGLVMEINGFTQIYKDSYAYLQGTYVSNPRELNGVQQPNNEPDFTLGQLGYLYNAVPDQYLGRGGFGYVIWPKYALSLTLGARIEGVPVHDFIGGDNGFRQAGYAISIEPGISAAKGRYSITITGPIAVERHADQNTTDIRLSRKFGMTFGGNAAFADYLITTSISVVF